LLKSCRQTFAVIMNGWCIFHSKKSKKRTS